MMYEPHIFFLFVFPFVVSTLSSLPSLTHGYLRCHKTTFLLYFLDFLFLLYFDLGLSLVIDICMSNFAGLAFVVYRFYVGIGCVRELWIKIQKNKLVLLMVLSWKIIGFKKCFYFADMNKEIVVNFRLMMLDWCFKWVENLWNKKGQLVA